MRTLGVTVVSTGNNADFARSNVQIGLNFVENDHYTMSSGMLAFCQAFSCS